MEFSTPKDIFLYWAHYLEADPLKWNDIDSNYLWTIDGKGGGQWLLEFINTAKITTTNDGLGRVNCQIASSADDFLDLVFGKLNLQQAFLDGKLKIVGERKAVLFFNVIFRRIRNFLVESNPAGGILA